MILSFLFGPKPNYPTYDGKVDLLNISLNEIEDHIKEKEAKVPNLKPNNESEIVWFDGVKKTEYSIVYLHGFSASKMEADPLHKEMAKRYGCNLFLHRMAKHGIDDTEIFADLSPADMINAAKEALAVGKILGEKVILLSTSTGGTFSVYLAAHNPELIHSMIMYSPNFDLYDNKSRMLLWPWGLQLARKLIGEYRTVNFPDAARPYWMDYYRVEGIIALKYLVSETMTEDVFKKVKTPYFAGYYYESEEEQDKIISVAKIREFHKLTATPEEQKVSHPFPSVKSHVISSKWHSKNTGIVKKTTYRFVEDVLGIEAVAFE